MNLFKLKKNGTTIGYMRLSGAFANYKLSLKDEKWLFQRDFENLPEINTSVVSFEALPYVCNDKNGEKLFAGDKVLLWGAQKGRIEKLDTILLRYGIRFWDEQYQHWFHFISNEKFIQEDIELIKEDNNG